MKKFAKLSLVTSVALASCTFANAQELSEAIKNVDISGTMAVRYNDYENGSNSDNYKAAINLKSKVNDDVTSNVRIVAGSNDATQSATEVLSRRGDQADTELNVTVSEAFFAYTGLANTSLQVGKQAINTPFTVYRDSIGVEQTGSAVSAITNIGPVDLTAAYFNNTNLNKSNELPFTGLTIDGSENLIFIGANLNIGTVNIDASYIDLSDRLDAYTIGLSASYKVGEVALNSFARYTSLDRDDVDTDNNLFKIGVGAKMGIFGANLAYGETDKEGGEVAFDGSAEAGMDEHWRVTLTGERDASVVYASVNAQVTPKLNVALKYSDMERGSNQTDLNEIYVQTTYNMSKNFMTYVRFGQYDDEANESTSGRLHMQYNF